MLSLSQENRIFLFTLVQYLSTNKIICSKVKVGCKKAPKSIELDSKHALIS